MAQAQAQSSSHTITQLVHSLVVDGRVLNPTVANSSISVRASEVWKTIE